MSCLHRVGVFSFIRLFCNNVGDNGSYAYLVVSQRVCAISGWWRELVGRFVGGFPVGGGPAGGNVFNRTREDEPVKRRRNLPPQPL